MDKREQWKYLFNIIRYSLSGGRCPEIEEDPNWEYLYGICKRHKIESMVSNGLDTMPKEQQPPEEIRQKFRKKLNTDTAREAVQYFSLEELLEEFEDKGVDCLPLKGALLKQFYEKPALRTMADLDILYRSEQKEEVHQILLDLGYECEAEGDHHDAYFRNPYMNIEMHHCLIAEGEKYSEYYDDVWTRIHRQECKKHIYEFSWEDYYIYMLVHLAKHFRFGGSGIRSVVDIWIFLTHMKERLDWKYIEKELEKVQLKEFHIHMQILTEIWFENRETEPFYDELTAFVADSGIYGSHEHSKIRAVLEKSGNHNTVAVGEFGIRMELIFLPLKYMKIQYTYLEKYPFLLPAAWIQRILRTIFKRKGRAAQVLESVKVDETEALKNRDLFRTLGL